MALTTYIDAITQGLAMDHDLVVDRQVRRNRVGQLERLQGDQAAADGAELAHVSRVQVLPDRQLAAEVGIDGVGRGRREVMIDRVVDDLPFDDPACAAR